MPERSRIGPWAPGLAIVGALAMAGMLAYGFANGYFLAQGGAIASIAWGQVLLVDIYVGMLLFAGWIAWREAGRPAIAATWIVALLLIGNLVACAYVLLAWRQSRGVSATFWNGRRA
jgi:uncharacterized membrane protein